MSHAPNIIRSIYISNCWGNHLFLANKQKVQYIDCRDYPLPFGAQLVHDLQTREETAVTQAHTFTVSELALRAQQLAHNHNSRAVENDG